MRTGWMSLCSSGLLVVSSVVASAADPKPLFDSQLVTRETPGHAKKFDVELEGAKELYLVTRDGGDGFTADWADWAEPVLVGPQGSKKLTELKWKKADAQWGEVRTNANAAGQPLKINGQSVADGIGTHANSVIVFDVPAGYTRFQGRVGLDNGGTDQGSGSTVQFLVYNQKPPANIVAPSNGGGQGSRDLAEAVDQLDVAEGLQATLFAGEPRLLSPSNIDVDHLGRVWVCEVVNYRSRNGERPEGDRILILEDTNGDGQADKQTVFYQGRDIDTALGICVLGNKVIVSVAPNVFVFTDENGDGKADKKETLFTNVGQPQHDHSTHAFVFGPDGKLYWNVGNTGKQVCDKDGKPIVDKAGNVVNDSGKPYRQGLVFRCNMDGSEFEVLGNNFRNNYEVTVDSFGTLWQSDNDDDGNRGVRINYVMEYGNFGYVDEFTGASWQTPRTNLETEIPLRHWHLNDPGVVPNLLQTGAGSPTGICLYEGDLLPEVFRNQIIHCDAGPNVVRAYPAKTSGAGYTAEMVNVLEGARDKWFRPSDVCVAPDGSLIVADWYDPGVGGHRMGDTDKGRLFRVAPPGANYAFPKPDFSTVDGALAALKSPNQATRYLAWTALHEMGEKAEAALAQAYRHGPNPRYRARAFWLLSKFPPRGMQYIVQGLHDADPDLRIAAIRAARQHNVDVEKTLGRLAKDPSPAVRRELAIALRTVKAPKLWAELAQQYDGQDRWALEALGIGAAFDWDACLAAYLDAVPSALKSRAGRDIVWRSRATQTPALLAQIIADQSTPYEELPRYFRAYDFLTGDPKSAAITQLAFATTAADPAKQAFIVTEALNRLPGFDVSKDPAKLAQLNKVLDSSRGTVQFLSLVDRFNLETRYPEIIAILQQQPDSSLAVDAVKMLLGKEHRALIQQALKGDDPLLAAAVAKALGNATDNRTTPLLLAAVNDAQRPLGVRQEATKGLARSKQGIRQLLDLVKSKKLAEELTQAAAFGLQTQSFDEFKPEIAAIFPPAPARNDQPLPPLAQLLKTKGAIDKGKNVFNTVGKCNTCHVVNNEGKDVGPNLSEIGSKLSREALFESILFPSAGISHNYETWTVVTDAGNTLTGIKVSETGDTFVIRGSDAITRTLKKSEIEEVKKQTISLMPADLQKTMTAEELVDVIEYVQTLKKK